MTTLQERDRFNNEYFEWMYKLVCDDRFSRTRSYRKLLQLLHAIRFEWVLDRDSNRASDGISFRYRFGYEAGYTHEQIDMYLDNRPCSVLEMMVALAVRIETDIMDDPKHGNRTGQWFWNMVASLGLGSYDDHRWDRRDVESMIFKFMDRKYDYYGRGGLFIVHEPSYDMRDAEIWHQAMWYLDEFLKN